jgi:hypothetical protein
MREEADYYYNHTGVEERLEKFVEELSKRAEIAEWSFIIGESRRANKEYSMKLPYVKIIKNNNEIN